MRFPSDVPRRRVIRAFEALGFRIVRQRAHISMVRDNSDGTRTPLTMPNHPKIKSSTLRAICTQVGVSREEFLDVLRER
ncbi:MAG: hypothetical protein BZY88_16880 [SAR202 cluster bacterium Io17-Chloro-G9]|nr:MAG: hypothetical protein BZY88_16880 [SAR202 cluster bacterium Io17-Chloro-G9]